jgi:hypothetical protein
MVANVESRQKIKRELAELSGPLLLILDLDLYSRAPNPRAPNPSVVRGEILTSLESVLNDAPAGRDAVLISDALDELKQFRGLTAVEGMTWIDGIEFGMAAIQNQHIRPLLIRLATTIKEKDKIERIIIGLAEAVRGEKPCCQVGSFPQNITRLSENSLEDPEVKPTFLTKRIDRDACLQIARMAPECGSVVDVLRTYLNWVRGFDHLAFSKMPDSLLEDQLVALLGIEEAQWQESLRPHLAMHLRVAIRGCGATFERGLGLLPAWLLALSAYQQADKSRDWRTVFDPLEISACNGVDWGQMLITPYLTEYSGDRVRSLHDAIEHYYRMCITLFRRERQNPHGPLSKVALSRDKDKCLSFRLAFNAWKEADGRRCLAENISRWRCGYLGKPGTGHQWDKPFEASPNSSARAIWNWWLATAVHDYPYGVESVFGTSTYLPMRIELIEDQTELVFGDRK